MSYPPIDKIQKSRLFRYYQFDLSKLYIYILAKITLDTMQRQE